MGVKKYVHQLTRSLGFDFYSLKDKVDDEVMRLNWLKRMNIRTVFDIGANEGQFAAMIRNLLPAAIIYSFEPIPFCYQKLVEHFKDDNNFKAFNIGSGDKEEEIGMNVNDYSPSSSLLEINELHVKNFRHTAHTQKQLIKIKPLDAMMDQFTITTPLMVKIDTQGYENKVITGGKALLAKADVIMIELSYQSLYKGQTLFHDIYNSLYDLGFQYHGNFEQLLSPVDGSVLQSDGIFLKRQQKQ